MKYRVNVDQRARKQLEKLPADLARRIILKLYEVAETGRGLDNLKGSVYGYKVRVGDYRVLVDVTYNPDTIWVRFIGQRGTIYERL